MNFNEWYETMPGLGISEHAIASVAWKACKKEALKIIEDGHECVCDYDHGQIIKEIEKL